MKKHKNILIFILTTAIILLCAMLPVIAGVIQDSLDGQSINYQEMRTVQFSRELSDLEKLSLLRYGEMLDVSEEKTRLKIAQVQDVAKSLLEPYINTGMMPVNFEDFIFSASPKLFYNNTSSGISGIFWMIDMKSEDGNHMVSMCIDDQDEDLMLVSYDCMMDIYSSLGLERDYILNTFCEIYFDRITIINEETTNAWVEQAILPDDNDSGNENIEYVFPDIERTKSTSSIQFHWGNEKNGDINMKLSVYHRGFFNGFD